MKKFLTYSTLLLLVIQLTSCLEYKEVEVIKVVDVGVKDISIQGVDVEVAMQIKNPNKYDISIIDSDLNLFLKGNKVGKASIKEKVTLKKKSNSVYRFIMQSSLKDLASGGLPALMGLISSPTMELRVQGDIKARAKGISKSVPIDFKENITL